MRVAARLMTAADWWAWVVSGRPAAARVVLKAVVRMEVFTAVPLWKK